VDEAQQLLLAMVDATAATKRTNLYMPHRYALALRVDPALLLTAKEKADSDREMPFGAFYVYGRRFTGIHCRFRVSLQ
jgi:glutamate dehydrogenase